MLSPMTGYESLQQLNLQAEFSLETYLPCSFSKVQVCLEVDEARKWCPSPNRRPNRLQPVFGVDACSTWEIREMSHFSDVFTSALKPAIVGVDGFVVSSNVSI